MASPPPPQSLSMLDSLLAATAVAPGADANTVLATMMAVAPLAPGEVAPDASGLVPVEGASPGGAVRAPPKPRQRGSAAAGRSVMPTGARLRWTTEEDDELRRAVTENRGSATKKSISGIRWAEIQRRAPLEYLLLMRHLTTPSSKCLSKRWCQFLSPDDQPNKARKWR